MLPVGLDADLLGPPEHQLFRQRQWETQTVARLVHGACSCDLVLQRRPISKEDEAWLRQRYRELKLSRADTIRALETHRRAAERPPKPAGHWPVAVAAFVVEHARNAGPTLYLLHFGRRADLTHLPAGAITTTHAREVKANPSTWLPEATLVLVQP